METIDGLRQHYSRRFRADEVKAELRRLTDRYLVRWELTAQAVACGVAVTALADTGAIDVSHLDPQVREAFELAYPNVPIDSLSDASPEQLAGYVNAWKGKLFEVQVRDQLQAGETVGGIELEGDQIAELARSVTQPGWDLQILNDDDTVAELVQLKATESIAYVNQAMERYPDIHVLATSDLAGHANVISGLSTAGVSEEELQRAVEAPLADIADDSIWDALLPGLPFFIIGARQGLAVFSGERNWKDALAIAAIDGARTAVAIGGGVLAAEVATEVAGELATDLMGEVAADLLLGAILPFGVGFLIRKLLGGGRKPKRLNTIPAAPALNHKLINDWVIPRALLVQRTVAKYYLPPPGGPQPASEHG